MKRLIPMLLGAAIAAGAAFAPPAFAQGQLSALEIQRVRSLMGPALPASVDLTALPPGVAAQIASALHQRGDDQGRTTAIRTALDLSGFRLFGN